MRWGRAVEGGETCHADGEVIRELGCTANIRDKVASTLEAGVCWYPVFFTTWWIYKALGACNTLIRRKPRKDTHLLVTP